MIGYPKLDTELKAMYEKYWNLVWFARATDADGKAIHAVGRRGVKRIAKLYPEDCKAIKQGDDNWTHGFNSGMLAAMAFLGEAKDFGLGYARDNFPMLDS